MFGGTGVVLKNQGFRHLYHFSSKLVTHTQCYEEYALSKPTLFISTGVEAGVDYRINDFIVCNAFPLNLSYGNH